MANNTDILSSILAECKALREEVATLKGLQASSKPPSKRSSTPKDPSAPAKPRKRSSWDDLLSNVRSALKDAGLKGNAMSYASYLKTTYPDAYGWDAEAIVAEYPNWTPPPPKPKEPKAEGSEEAPKPKRTITPEHHAKMMEGKKAAAEARKAANLASQDAEATPPPPKAESPPPPPASKLTPFPFKGQRCLLDPSTNGLWKRAEDGSQGAWLGVLSKDRKTLDASIPDPNGE